MRCRRSGHHVLLLGFPGAGTSTLAQRLTTSLPAMTPDKALETARILFAGVLDLNIFAAFALVVRARKNSGGGQSQPIITGTVTTPHQPAFRLRPSRRSYLVLFA